jgi:magnesium transporter
MEIIETSEPWKVLARLADEGDSLQLQKFLDELPASQIVMAVSRLSDDHQQQLLTKLSPTEAAGLVEQLPDVQVVELLEQMSPTTAAAILDQLPSSEQADLIGDLDDEEAEAILQKMNPEDAADARALSRYDDDTAGGLMVTEFLRYPENIAVRDVVEDMRSRADEYRDYDVQYTYVCDALQRLTGVLRLRDLLLARGDRPSGN